MEELRNRENLLADSGAGCSRPIFCSAACILSWLADQPEKVRSAALPSVLSRIQTEGNQAAADWLMQLPASPERTRALAETASSWASLDPRAAADFSLALPPGTDRDYAILNTALAWQRNDPRSAHQWVEGLEDSPIRARALTELEKSLQPE